MKKIIKSSMLVLAVCFFAGKASAQLTSDKPAMTAQQMTDLLQQRAATAKSATNTVAVSSDKPSLTAAQTDQLKKTKVEPAVEPAKIIATPVSATKTTVPTVSNQGGVQPVASDAKPASVEIKATQVQDPKVKSKD